VSQFYVIKLFDTIIYCKFVNIMTLDERITCCRVILVRKIIVDCIPTISIRLYRNIIPRNIITTTTYYNCLLPPLLLLLLLQTTTSTTTNVVVAIIVVVMCIYIKLYATRRRCRRVDIGRRVFADRDHCGRRVGWRRHGMTSAPSLSIRRRTRSTTRTRPPADTAP